MTAARARKLRRDQTDAESVLWSYLRNRRLGGWKFRRQVPKGRYIVDFCCNDARLVVELDGSQHARQTSVERDAVRTAYLQESGYRVMRFWNNEIDEDLDAVLQAIWNKLQEPPLPDDVKHSLEPSGRGF